MNKSQIQAKPARNQSIECARMVASFFVVFIHCSFPGMLGEYINCIGRFAVPMFLVISGYFCYQASDKKILAQAKDLLKLYLTAAILYLSWNLFKTEWGVGALYLI